MVASSSDAAYWPSRYSSTYDGTIALPLTALTRSLRTTTPAKCSLIFLSRAVCSGVWSVVFSAATPSGESSSMIRRSASSVISVALEVEVRREGALERAHGLLIDAPLVRVGDAFFEAKLDSTVVVVVGVLVE